MREDEKEGALRPLKVVVPDQPPTLTPGLATSLLRLLRRRMDAKTAAGKNSPSRRENTTERQEGNSE
ncbi:hypothetical protein [Candidatus Protofrankia californiensis]|uniref:hypothetical protein n=1 Tax=Candidatus Protofrankia californiensis TaxID=1839754 RepID=UPI001040F773|nr:hypothetical protein [Candidatus Protofrankia californiensis]